MFMGPGLNFSFIGFCLHVQKIKVCKKKIKSKEKRKWKKKITMFSNVVAIAIKIIISYK